MLYCWACIVAGKALVGTSSGEAHGAVGWASWSKTACAARQAARRGRAWCKLCMARQAALPERPFEKGMRHVLAY